MVAASGIDFDLAQGSRGIGWGLTIKVPCGNNGCTHQLSLLCEPMRTDKEEEIVLETLTKKQKDSRVCPVCSSLRKLTPEELETVGTACEGVYNELRKIASNQPPPKT